MKSKTVLWQAHYYNLLAEKKDKKIHVLQILIFRKPTVILSISRNSLQIPPLDDILWEILHC